MEKCRVDGCKEPVYGAVPMPTEDHSSTELWHYCKTHYRIYGSINQMIDKFVGKESTMPSADKLA